MIAACRGAAGRKGGAWARPGRRRAGRRAGGEGAGPRQGRGERALETGGKVGRGRGGGREYPCARGCGGARRGGAAPPPPSLPRGACGAARRQPSHDHHPPPRPRRWVGILGETPVFQKVFKGQHRFYKKTREFRSPKAAAGHASACPGRPWPGALLRAEVKRGQ